MDLRHKRWTCKDTHPTVMTNTEAPIAKSHDIRQTTTDDQSRANVHQ